MEYHCFDSILDPLTERIAKATKQLISMTSGDIIDIGAFKGSWTDYVYNNMLSDKRRIHLFEPHPVSYAELQRKYKGVARINVNNLAISSRRQEVSLICPITDASRARVISASENKIIKDPVFLAPAASIDSLYQTRHIGILKMRTNGHELHILSGAQKTLQNNNIEAIIWEFSPAWYEARDDPLIIQKYITSLLNRFTYMYILERSSLKITFLSSPIDIFDFLLDMEITDIYDCICTNNMIQIDP